MKQKKNVKYSLKKVLEILESLEPLFRLIEVIFIVVGTILVSVKANKIAEMQLNLSKTDIQPEFKVQETICSNIEGEENSDAVITVSIISGKCNNVDIDTICYIRYSYLEDTVPKTIDIDLSDFFWAYIWGGEDDGTICTIKNENNWKNYANFSLEVLRSEDIECGYVDLFQYVKIYYEDELGEEHTNYYRIDTIHCELLNQEEGEVIFREHSLLNKKMYIDQLSVDNLLKVIE